MRLQFSGPPQKRGFCCACVLCLPPASAVQAARGLRAFSLPRERPRQPGAWAPSPRVRRAFSLRGPSTRRQSGLQINIFKEKTISRDVLGILTVRGASTRAYSYSLALEPKVVEKRG